MSWQLAYVAYAKCAAMLIRRVASAVAAVVALLLHDVVALVVVFVVDAAN